LSVTAKPHLCHPRGNGVQTAAAGSAGELAETAAGRWMPAWRKHDTPTPFSVTPVRVTPVKTGVQTAAAGGAGELAETAAALVLEARLREHDTQSVAARFRGGDTVGWTAPVAKVGKHESSE
jgi:hypothetical protein